MYPDDGESVQWWRGVLRQGDTMESMGVVSVREEHLRKLEAFGE